MRLGARSSLALGFSLALAACEVEEEKTWVQYNADNAVFIEVGAAKVLPPAGATLTSNTGSVALGTASVDPGGGPINETTYEVLVTIDAEYADDIGRVTVRTSSGDRGEDEYDMVQDSTGQGIWVFEMVALGEKGETRSDELTFLLWQEEVSE